MTCKAHEGKTHEQNNFWNEMIDIYIRKTNIGKRQQTSGFIKSTCNQMDVRTSEQQYNNNTIQHRLFPTQNKITLQQQFVPNSVMVGKG